LKIELLEDRTLLSPVLIQDLNTHTRDSNPQSFVAVGNLTYFVADDGFHGPEIWKTDGTTLSVVVPSSTAYQPADLTNVSGTLFFTARDAAHGRELWKYDGTAASLVADINPGIYDSDPTQLTNVNGTLYFAANDGTHGDELWKYDGTSAHMVADINPYQYGNGPHDFANLNGTLFFGEYDGTGDNLYETDATSAHKVAGFTDVSNLTVFNGAVYFAGNEPLHGRELWRSDGTNTGIVADVNLGSGSSNPYGLTAFNNKLLFGANDGTHGNELWFYDGQTTYGVLSTTAPDPWNYRAVLGGMLFFPGTDAAHGDQLWKTDGTNTSMVTVNPTGNANPAYLTVVNGTLYFTASDGTHGTELWKSDGNTATFVDDIQPGLGSSAPNNLVNINGTLFFAANDGVHGNELWTSDGTTAGTRLFQDIDTATDDSDPIFMTNLNGSVFFAASDGVHGEELWKTDGTTCTLFDLNPGPGGSQPSELTVLNGQLFFAAYDPTHDVQLWKTDGSTPSIVNFAPGVATRPRYLTVSNGWLYFAAYDGVHGRELWRTDGTTTTMVADINPTGDSNPQNLIAMGGKVYFMATDGTHGCHLWTTDGTTTTMTPVSFDIFYGPLSPFTAVNGTLFFAANDGTHGQELWKTDGTTVSMVADINPGSTGSNPQYLTAANGLVFFQANDGAHGLELWQSDGTNTSMVADTNPGPASSTPILLTAVNNTLFFEAYSPTYGNGLWKTTGGSATLVGSYDPTALTAINGLLYFVAVQGPQPGTLYKTDGATTTAVADFTGLTVQDGFVDVNNTLFFGANDVAHGFEPWKLGIGTGGIVDNGMPGYSETGTWYSYSISRAYGGTERYASSAGNGNNTATWQVTGLAAGYYAVQASWDAASNQATDAPYAVYDGSTLLATVPVDQTQKASGVSYGGVPFQTLATVAVGSGTLKVVLSNTGTNGTYIDADAVRVAALPPPVVDLNWAAAGAGISGPATVTTPTTFTVSRTYDIAGGTAPGSFTIAYYASASSDPKQDLSKATLLGTETVSAAADLTAGNHAGTSPPLRLGLPGTYYLLAHLSTTNFIESDAAGDSNDVAVAPSPVTVTGAAFVDNGGPGYSETGSWQTYASNTAYGGTERYASSAGSGNNTATWQVSGLAAGSYVVQVAWDAYSNQATDAPYAVYDGSTLLTTVRVDQTKKPVGSTYGGVPFQALATVTVNSGTLKVVLSNTGTNSTYINADAVRVASA
jgi:ELWxxDGT repeat protein